MHNEPTDPLGDGDVLLGRLLAFLGMQGFARPLTVDHVRLATAVARAFLDQRCLIVEMPRAEGTTTLLHACAAYLYRMGGYPLVVDRIPRSDYRYPEISIHSIHASPAGILPQPAMVLFDSPQTATDAASEVEMNIHLQAILGNWLNVFPSGVPVSAVYAGSRMGKTDLIARLSQLPQWEMMP